MARRFQGLNWLIALLALGACRTPNGTGSVVGTAVIQNCTDADDTKTINGIAVDTIFAQPLIDAPLPVGGTSVHRLNIRLQHGSAIFYLTDGLTVQILDVAKIAALGSTPVTVGPQQLVRAQLEAFFTCPVAAAVGVGTGTITFTRPLSDDFGSEVSATYDLELTDGRGQGAFEGHASGAFDFVIERGQPAQRFP